ncbi:MAG TPA: cephalosporin hydroxylase family protein [Phycisphaerae bacterium]|nr:cephalosporin hydroxylase family protein [Phycisphaerae bacterium]
MAADPEVRDLRRRIYACVVKHRYVYNFSWLGRPIIQFPQDVVAVQEILWRVRPDLVVETGVARGGSLVLSASILELVGHGEVLGIDIEIRPHNRRSIEAHPLSKRIRLIEGSSTDPAVVEEVRAAAAGRSGVVVILDSLHTHEHVLEELRLYSPLVGKGSYLIAFDTAIDDVPGDAFPDRPWGKGNNPKTAVREFMQENSRFEVDRALEDRLGITSAPGGFLRCIAD